MISMKKLVKAWTLDPREVDLDSIMTSLALIDQGPLAFYEELRKLRTDVD